MISNDCHSEAIELKYILLSNTMPIKKLLQIASRDQWILPGDNDVCTSL